ncbi:MAG: ATP-binding protein [Pseudomonadota bacterium]
MADSNAPHDSNMHDSGYVCVPPTSKGRARKSILDAPRFSPFRYRRMLLPTQAITEFVNAIADWIRTGTPGALVYAHSRFGKTSSIKYMCQFLNLLLGIHWPVFSITCANNRGQRPGSYYEHILEDLCFVAPANGRVADKRRSILNTIEAACIHRDAYNFILFVDEVQAMTEDQWGYLLELYNQFERRDLQPLVILVGQHEAKDIPGVIRGTNRWPVLGRFMQEVYPFRGVESADDLKRLLRSYDEDSAALDTDNRPITRIALPKAYHNGLRLEAVAEEVWHGLTTARETRMPDSPLKSYPMPVITAGVLGTLSLIASRDAPNYIPSRKDFKRGFLSRGGGLLNVDYDRRV